MRLNLLSVFLFVLAYLLGFAVALPKISAVGSKFFTEDGDQFYLKGVAYQLTPDDPLVNAEQCQMDASLMKKLGANAIRVYHVNPRGDHKECMKAFDDAGIYLFVDLDDFPTQIEQEHPHWNETQLDMFKKVLDEFQKYDNTAGVFVGNEVLTKANGSESAPYILAAARDIKAYRDSKGYREIPVGYSAADIAELRPMLQNYLACPTNSSESLDFFSLNAYEWCGPNTYQHSGYSMLQKNATDYPIPIFFSETGCNTNRPRDFQDLTAIYGPEMAGTWSGAIVYEWIQEANDYGLISYGPTHASAAPTNTLIQDGFSRQGTPTPVSPDFDNLKSRWAALSPTGVALSDYSASATSLARPTCPASTSGVWDVDPSSPLPTLGQTLGVTVTDSATAAGPTESKEGAAVRVEVFGGQHGFKLMSFALLGLAMFMGWSL